MKVNFGDILLVNFDLSFGKEIRKKRPALVVSSNIINEKSSFAVIIPLTTNLKFINPIRVLIKKSNINNLESDSVAYLDQIKSVDKKRIIQVIGKVSKKEMNEVQEGLDVVLNRY